MSQRDLPKWVAAGLGGALALAATGVALSYQRDLRQARARVAAGGRILHTACGPIEYAEGGQGSAVLVLHGAGGGYDQGMLLGDLLGRGQRLIAPSRFGYLNSPILADGSLESQARAYACLLDSLGVQRAAVIAVSAGGPSGLQFAMSYPERVSGLVLAAAISYNEPTPQEARAVATINRLIGSDFIYWLGLRLARPQVVELLGVSRSVQACLTQAEQAQIDQFLQAMLPMGPRLPGIQLDQQCVFPRDYPLDQIQVPTLVIHARDDRLVSFDKGQHSAARIPGAEFMVLEDGGHFMAGHAQEIQERVAAFVNL